MIANGTAIEFKLEFMINGQLRSNIVCNIVWWVWYVRKNMGLCPFVTVILECTMCNL